MVEPPSDFDAFMRDRAGPDLPEGFSSVSSVVCLAAPGTPVIYVSPAFEAYTGYAPSEAVGRNLSFLQGPETEPEAVARFRELIDRREAGSVRITNYRRDGTRFTHVCELRPVRGRDGAVSHFVAVQRLENGGTACPGA